jgi:membrane protein DedA with SNARE-associated domain
MTDSNPKKNKFSNFIQFSSLGFQMLAFMAILGYAGYFLDQKFQIKESYFTILGLMLGVIASTIYVIVSLKKMTK